MANNLLDKSSIILTPTAYNNGEALCVKPSDGSGDFDFSRNSAATRVNAQGLVENVQILSSNLVQNGDFSEEGVQEVSNGSFSQEGSELIVNGDFDTDSDWFKSGQVTIGGGVAYFDSDGTFTQIAQNLSGISGKNAKVVIEVTEYNQGTLKVLFSGGAQQNLPTSVGTHTLYFSNVSSNTLNIARVGGVTNIKIDNVSVREVGQDWTLGTGWSIGEDKASSDGSQTSNSSLFQPNVLTQNKYYKFEFTLSNVTSGAVRLRNGIGDSETYISYQNSNGTYTAYSIVNSSNKTLVVDADSSFIGSITNISVKEVGQNWDLQTGWQISNNKLNCLGASSQIEASTLLNFDITKKYKLVFTISGVDSGTRSFRVYTQGSNGGVIFSYTAHTNGTYEYYYDPSINGTKLAFQTAFNQSTFSIDDVSVIEITDDTNLPRINYEGFSYQDALGSELVTNGTFDSDTAWSKGAGWSIANGEATHTGSASYLSQSILNPNTQYKVKIKVSQASGSNFVQIYMGGSPASVLIQNVGEYEYIFTSQPSIGLGFALRGAGNVTIDNVSVKEYLGQEVVPDSGCGSWLFESQSTNLVTDSEDYSQWTPTGVSVTSNSTTSPDGLINGTLLSTNGGTSSRLIRNYGLPTSATIKVLSIYAKANLSNFIQLLLNGDAQSYVNFDVSNGVVGTSGTKTTGEIQSVGNGWYRCIAYFDSTTIFGASSFVALTISNSVGYSGYATSDDLNVYIWGSQYEENNISSYIPTSGSTVTRNQDVCTNGGSLATINSTEGVLYAEIAALADGVGTRTMSLSDGTANNSITIRYTTSVGVIQAFVVSGGSFQFNANISGVSVLDFNKVAIKYSLNDMALWINGVEVATDTSGTMPLGLNEINFTRGDGANKFFGKTKAVAVWKEALSDSELQSLTTI